MSVEQINAAETPQRNNSTNYAVAGGATAGAAGALAGRFLGKTPMDLDKVFAMEPDTFETKVKNLTGEEKTEADKIKAEIDKLNGEEYKADTAEVKEKISGVNVDDVEGVKTKQNAVNEKILAKINDGRADGAKLSLDDLAKPDNAEAKQAAIEALKDDADYKKAVAELEDVRLSEQIKKVEAGGDTITDEMKSAVSAYKTKVKDAATKKTNKISELAGQDAFKNAYAKIKGAFKEVSWKNVGIWGGIALAAGAIIGYLVGGNKNA